MPGARRPRRRGDTIAVADRPGRRAVQPKRVDRSGVAGPSAVELAETTDEPDSRGAALLALAKVLAGAGKQQEASAAARAAEASFRSKGNIVDPGRAELTLLALSASRPAVPVPSVARAATPSGS